MLIKKLGKAEGERKTKTSAEEKLTLDDIVLAGLERGLTMSDVRAMQLGQVVDFCVSYNERHERAEKKAKLKEKQGTKRKAGQGDINSFFG